jgi:uncharacterized protein DUF4956
MGKFQSFQEYLSTQSLQVEPVAFVINLCLAAVLAYILSLMYVRFGNSLSNRTQFARNFMLMTMTTMLIITIVKSSLALSLGLVGALSIVRFRAAIKEPEELSYLFLAIAIGLGLGADQRIITLIAFVIIGTLLTLRSLRRRSEEHTNLYLTVACDDPENAPVDKIVEVLSKTCNMISLRRLDEAPERIEAHFMVEYDGFKQLEASRTALKSLNKSIKLTYLDNRGIE